MTERVRTEEEGVRIAEPGSSRVTRTLHSVPGAGGLGRGRNSAMIRQINRTQVVQALLEHGPLTRPRLAELLGVTTATVFNVCAELVEEGLLVERAGDSFNRRYAGRRPLLLEIRKKARGLVGAEVRIDRISGAVMDLTGEVAEHRTTPLTDVDPESVLQALATLIEELLASPAATARPVLGIGVGLPGLTTQTGIVRYAPNLGWHSVAVSDYLRGRFPSVPIFTDNNVRVLALAEKYFGLGRGVESLIAYYVGRGIGAGVILDNRLVVGHDHGAGEIGHVPIEPNGPLCSCGNRGCLDATASERAVLRMAYDGLQRGTWSLPEGNGQAPDEVLQAVFHAAQQGDGFCLEVLRQAGERLGRGLVVLINLFNPERIVLNGRLFHQPAVLKAVQEVAARGSFSSMGRSIPIVLSRLGGQAGVIGAASLALFQSLPVI